jgi:transcription elongation factor Elf1
MSTLRCYCGWTGDSDERVPATPEWVAENDVDPEHFLNGNFNCPECGDSKGWDSLDDDGDGIEPYYSDGSGADYVRCPSCESYTEASELALTGGDGFSVCPQCGHAAADDEFIAGE